MKHSYLYQTISKNTKKIHTIVTTPKATKISYSPHSNSPQQFWQDYPNIFLEPSAHQPLTLLTNQNPSTPKPLPHYCSAATYILTQFMCVIEISSKKLRLMMIRWSESPRITRAMTNNLTQGTWGKQTKNQDHTRPPPALWAFLHEEPSFWLLKTSFYCSDAGVSLTFTGQQGLVR